MRGISTYSMPCDHCLNKILYYTNIFTNLLLIFCYLHRIWTLFTVLLSKTKQVTISLLIFQSILEELTGCYYHEMQHIQNISGLCMLSEIYWQLTWQTYNYSFWPLATLNFFYILRPSREFSGECHEYIRVTDVVVFSDA